MLVRQVFIASLFVLGSCTAIINAQEQAPAPGKQVEQSFVAQDQGKVPYLLYLPQGFEKGNKKVPLMLFLHGRGESDGPLQVVAKWGPPQLLAKGESMPYVVLSPQCPKEDNWSSPTQQKRLLELLDDAVGKWNIDPSRIYLTGLSMGGSGSWRMAADHPQKFAAVVPICGRGDVKDAAAFKSLPTWVFCGDQDRVFAANSEMVDAIKKTGSNQIRWTSLENIGHNSWSAAYATPDLYTWLQQQSRPEPKKP